MLLFFGCFCREKTPIFTGLSFFICLFGFFESNGGISFVGGILYALFNNLNRFFVALSKKKVIVDFRIFDSHFLLVGLPFVQTCRRCFFNNFVRRAEIP